ncbi:MAG: phosphate ABC transporter permease PstA [Candidatus Magnetoovum sp. WYHC-5]|nr:phosphate ABC transporter permease PstA [Candidatus Magnetoovum sp. WYHC-5]
MTQEERKRLIEQRLKKRYLKEKVFRSIGLLAVLAALSMLFILFATIILSGYRSFQQTYIRLNVLLDKTVIAPSGSASDDDIFSADYVALLKATLKDMFPEVSSRQEKKMLYSLLSSGASMQVMDFVMQNKNLIGTKQTIWVTADDDFDMLIKGYIKRNVPEEERRIKDVQLKWIDKMMVQGRVEKRFNLPFFINGDSREPELAGIRGGLVGTFYTILVTLLLSFPLGVATAVYLEEFAPLNRWTDIVEVNINNLAAVPSIVFGLLGLAVFINFFGLPRSSPLVGGLVLTLVTLPTIIIASRAALKAVPPSIRHAALGIGASKMQAVIHHVIPLAMPGMMTGTIIGMARALGETASLLMIGMVAFIVETPADILEPATVLPVQIYLWADSAELAFVERTSMAIMVLLWFLIVMNGVAIVLRNKFEKRW